MDGSAKMIVAIDRSITDGAVDFDRARQDHYLYQGESDICSLFTLIPRLYLVLCHELVLDSRLSEK
jgi:hypothetical protein